MRKVKAEDLKRELTQDTGKVVPSLRKRRRLLPLRNAKIVGKFDLSHHTIRKPITFEECEFEDEVDLRYCDFERTVDFLRCTFHKGFNTGSNKEPRTVYRKDLNCSGSSFRAVATFIGIQVEDSGYFDGCRFEYEATDRYTVDFTSASFGSNIECSDAVFEGPVSFNSLECGDRGVFGGVEFGSEERPTPVDFTGATFGRNLECVKTKFQGRAKFDGLRCTDRGILRGACFQKEVSLRAAYFGSNIECSEAMFKNRVSFNGLKCEGSGYFDGVKFECEAAEECAVDFTGATFGSHVICTDAVFEGIVRFNSLRCAGSGHFDRAEFKRGVEFRLASFGLVFRCPSAKFGGQVDASWVTCDFESSFEQAIFEREVSFRGLRCGTTGNFKGATFGGAGVVDYRRSHFGADLDLRGAYFAGRAILAQCSILDRLRLGGAYFGEETELYGSEMKILELMDANYRLDRFPPAFGVRSAEQQGGFETIVKDREKLDAVLGEGSDRDIQPLVVGFFPFQKRSLNLIDITFKRFHGGPNRELSRKLALKLVEEQDPEKFSRDPYLQLEKFYTGIGEEDDAVKMRRRGHCALRENAKDFKKPDRIGNVKWSWFKIWVTDLGLKYLTGYGTRAWLSIVYLIPLLAIGTFIFWGEDTLLKKSDLTSVGYVPLGHSFVYSMDLLIPVLTFPITESWVPNYTWGKILSVIEVIAGWLLVPLFIAAWTGLIRPRNQ